MKLSLHKEQAQFNLNPLPPPILTRNVKQLQNNNSKKDHLSTPTPCLSLG